MFSHILKYHLHRTKNKPITTSQSKINGQSTNVNTDTTLIYTLTFVLDHPTTSLKKGGCSQKKEKKKKKKKHQSQLFPRAVEASKNP